MIKKLIKQDFYQQLIFNYFVIEKGTRYSKS